MGSRWQRKMLSSPNSPRRASGVRPVSASFSSIRCQCSNRLTAARTAAAASGASLRGCGDVAGERVEDLPEAGVGEHEPQFAAVVWQPRDLHLQAAGATAGHAARRSASSASRCGDPQCEHAAAARVPDGDEDVVGRLRVDSADCDAAGVPVGLQPFPVPLGDGHSSDVLVVIVEVLEGLLLPDLVDDVLGLGRVSRRTGS